MQVFASAGDHLMLQCPLYLFFCHIKMSGYQRGCQRIVYIKDTGKRDRKLHAVRSLS